MATQGSVMTMPSFSPTEARALEERALSMGTPARMLGFWTSADSPGELAAAIRSNRATTSAGPHRVAIIAETADELRERMDAAAAQLSGIATPKVNGVFHAAGPIGGRIAAAFTGVATSYPGMGYDLLNLLPAETIRSRQEQGEVFAAYLHALRPGTTSFHNDLQQMVIGSVTAMDYYLVARDVLKIAIDSVLGVSLGEFSMMLATGAYPELDAPYHRAREGGGMFESLRYYSDSPFAKKSDSNERIRWEN